MSETFVNVTEGSGKKLHADQKTIGANDVLDEYTLPGEAALSTYNLTSDSVSIATAASHPLQLMAGGSLNLFIRRIRVYQSVVATTAAIVRFQLIRLTTAGTGGTVATPRIINKTSPASGATGMTLPTVKGTEGSILDEATAVLTQTAPTAGVATLLVDWNIDQLNHAGSYYVAAGAANGLCVKNVAAHAGASVIVVATFTEANITPG